MAEPLLFANVGWMTWYEGQREDDHTLGNHAWLKKHKWGHEAWNFKPYRGKVYGYIPGRSSRIDIRKLDPQCRGAFVDGVTVVFMARHPRTRETRIVGWYSDAVVYREVGHATLIRARGIEVQYQVVADESRMKLLSVDERQFRIPTEKVQGNLGQSPLWYGGSDAFRQSVRAYIASEAQPPARSKARRGDLSQSADPAARKLIELAAVRHATAFYQSKLGGLRQVRSVEGDAAGWDLTVTGAGEVLKVEVKGLGGSTVCVELTPNEFAKMQSPEHRRDYVVYVVTEALTERAKSHIFYYNALRSQGREHIWTTHDQKQLKIEKRIAARLTAG
jgi:hypothetical protein